jgi:hypothetical protein
MRKAELTLALLRRSDSQTVASVSTAWVKLPSKGEVVGYCPPKARAPLFR